MSDARRSSLTIALVIAVVKYTLRSLVQPLNSAGAYIVLRQDKERFVISPLVRASSPALRSG